MTLIEMIITSLGDFFIYFFFIFLQLENEGMGSSSWRFSCGTGLAANAGML